MVMEGELEVELKSGKTRVMKAGESVAETVNELHNGRNKGSVPVKLLVFYAGDTEQPLTIKESPAQ
jgi:quercetin dioxygenase-like cupin family protein